MKQLLQQLWGAVGEVVESPEIIIFSVFLLQQSFLNPPLGIIPS